VAGYVAMQADSKRRAGLGHPGDSSDFIADAQWSIRESRAKRSRALIWVCLAMSAILLAWAAMGEIDEVVRGQGKVVPSRQVQIVQSLDGGVIEDILVREGEQVGAGQVLLRIDPTRYASSLGENRAESLSLKARAARLQALATGEPFTAPPDVLEAEPDLIEMEREVWRSRTRELEATLSIGRDQLKQRQDELRSTQADLEQAGRSCSLTSRELQVTRPLLKSGAVSEVDLLRLERDVARYCGERKSAAAQVDRLHGAIQEAESKIRETELNIRNDARRELSETLAKLATLSEGRAALADKVKLADIRSPVNGTVKTLVANTVGGVVQPGKEIVEIVPTDDSLLVEVRVLPRDIGFLHPGQKADVKFTAYDYAVYGGAEGEVELIGADTISDEKGNSFYLVRVRTRHAAVGDGDVLPIISGMLADVHILTGKRSLLRYLLKPVLRAKANALTER